MYYVTLSKIKSMASDTPRDAVGLAPNMPTVGEGWFMYVDLQASPTHESGVRYILTSQVNAVHSIEGGKEIMFKTQNSTYVITNISRAQPNLKKS